MAAKATATAAVLDQSRKALDNDLNDYPTARFRAVRLVKSKDGGEGFCGEINSKNRFGAYGGWSAFWLSANPTEIAINGLVIEGEPTKVDALFDTYGSHDPMGPRDSSGKVISSSCDGATAVDRHDYAPDFASG